MPPDPSASVDLTVEPDLDDRHAVSFPLARRGYEPHQVDHVVHELAAEIEGLRATVVELREREADLLVALDAADDRTRAIEVRAEQLESDLAATRAELESASRSAAAAREAGPVDDPAIGVTDAPAPFDIEALAPSPTGAAPDVAAIVGAETVRIVEAARHAAVEIGARAREDGERLIAAAREEARVIRADAEVQLLNRTREADDAVAARLLEAADAVQAAQSRAETIVADAFTEGATLVLRSREEAEANVAAGDQRAQELLDAATAARDDLLADLVRRRKVLRRQVEQLEAGRVRLRAAYGVVEATLGETTAELDQAPIDARDEALAAAARADDAPDPELAAAVAALGADPAIVTGPDPEPAESQAEAPAETLAEAPAGLRAEPQAVSAAPDEPAAPADEADSDPTDVAPVAVAPEAEPTEPEPVVEAATPAPDAGRRRRRRAPDPVEFEGRWSSAVRVLPPGGETDEDPDAAPGAGSSRRPPRSRSASDVFARLRADESHQPSLFDDEAAATGDLATGDLAAGDDVREAAEPAPSSRPDGPEPDELDVAEASADLEAGWVERRDAAFAPALRALRRRLKATLADDEDALLEAIKRAEPVPESIDSLRDATARRDDLAVALQSSLATAAAAGGELASSDPGVLTASPVAADVAEASLAAGPTTAGPDDLEPIARQLADEVVGPLDERLERSLARYHRTIAESDDPASAPAHDAAVATLVSSVKAAYRARRGVQVQVPTEDAVLRAGHRGLVATLEPGTPLRWVVVAPADGPRRGATSTGDAGDDVGSSAPVAGCPSCVAVADVGSGDRFGHGPALPPARSGCRCAVAPVVAVVPRRP